MGTRACRGRTCPRRSGLRPRPRMGPGRRPPQSPTSGTPTSRPMRTRETTTSRAGSARTRPALPFPFYPNAACWTQHVQGVDLDAASGGLVWLLTGHGPWVRRRPPLLMVCNVDGGGTRHGARTSRRGALRVPVSESYATLRVRIERAHRRPLQMHRGCAHRTVQSRAVEVVNGAHGTGAECNLRECTLRAMYCA
ncbi:hypothetical protein WOLCODRAFT_168124 [Wolfiporia cocos MD-104 SS10]|uniref:Uncharacterized protein n=1 Tax=Wolfiporia cocos (strain MD-104) TaxID=742152 RepID=A0A2H3J3J5_WOLCO|nr:hypothetical protein WOLCODRAFT_168124 [Wolfiporia cocos MD-104 SS10]